MVDTATTEHFSITDWRREVANGDTQLGYRQWVADRADAAMEVDQAAGRSGKLIVVEWTETATYRQVFSVDADTSVDLNADGVEERLKEVICDRADFSSVHAVLERDVDSATQVG